MFCLYGCGAVASALCISLKFEWVPAECAGGGKENRSTGERPMGTRTWLWENDADTALYKKRGGFVRATDLVPGGSVAP